MKLIIQIPCYNEEETLAVALQDLPKQIDGIDSIDVLIIDDGSKDDSVKVARENGVKHFVRFKKNKGLARGFMAGLDKCLQLGADIIVNTDADNQYKASDIEKLVKPILEGEADIVVGSRPIDDIEHFSTLKKLLQKVGSKVVRIVSKTKVKDATSGFRAISKDAAMQLNVFNEYTYTLETIIQAGQKNMAIISVPIGTNGYLRPSRLMSSITSYIRKSVATMVRIFVVYKPFRFFMGLGASVFSLGLIISLRYLYFFIVGSGDGHIQSLILSSVLLGAGFQIVLVAFLADLQSVNRRLLEDVQYRVKKNERIIKRSQEKLDGEE